MRARSKQDFTWFPFPSSGSPSRSPGCELLYGPSLILPANRYNETFEFDVSNPASVLGLECWEEDTFSNNYVGAINIPLRELSDGKKVGLGKVEEATSTIHRPSAGAAVVGAFSAGLSLT